MNTDASKNPKQYQQFEYNKAIKNNTLQSSGVGSFHTKMAQHVQIKQCDIPH